MVKMFEDNEFLSIVKIFSPRDKCPISGFLKRDASPMGVIVRDVREPYPFRRHHGFPISDIFLPREVYNQWREGSLP